MKSDSKIASFSQVSHAQTDLFYAQTDSIWIRQHVECPKELLDLPELWPQVDDLDGALLAEIKACGLDGPWSKHCCVKFLKNLRRSFLQDLPGLMQCFPDHPTWRAVPSLFKHPKFMEFQKTMRVHVKASHEAGIAPTLEKVRADFRY
jgi:hypothetical protein